MKKIILVILVFLTILHIASARSIETYETSTYFTTTMSANTYYYKNLDISNLIGKELVSFEITVTGEFTANTIFTMKLNGVSCSPITWATPSTDVLNYQMSFDCTDYFGGVGAVVDSSPNLIISYKTDKTALNIRPKVKEVYYVEDDPIVHVYGTEYTNTQMAKAWLQLLDGSGEYVNNGLCKIDIYTPDSEEFIEGAVMNSMNHDGIYYYDFETNTLVDGVYPVIAKCYFGTTQVDYNATSFTIINGQYQETIASDDFESNSYSGGTGWNNVWSFVNGGNCDITTLSSPIGTYMLRSNRNCQALRRFDDVGSEFVNISFYATATSLEGSETCLYQYFDGVTYNTLLTLADGDDDGSLDFYNFEVSSYGLDSNAGFRMTQSNGNGDYCYVDSIIITGTTNQNINSTYFEDGTSLTFIEEPVSGVSRVNVTIDYNNVSSCLEVDESLLSGGELHIYGNFDSVPNDDITMSIYNFTSSSWIDLPNVLIEGISFKTVTNSLNFNNITSAGLYQVGTGVRFKFEDTTFADSSNSNLLLDYVSFSCEQASDPVWQEVKGSSEVHITSRNDLYPFYYETLCGEDGGSACAQFLNNETIWNSTWGYIYENITIINNYQTAVDSYYIYETQLGQDCTAVFDVLENGTSIYDLVVFSLGSKDNCRIRFPVEFSSEDREINFEVFQDNYMKWEFERDNDYVNFFRLSTNPFCQDIALETGIPFVTPIDGAVDYSVLYANNPIYLGCLRAIDDIYWFDYYFNVSKNIDIAGEYESYLLEARFYYPELKSHAQIVQSLAKDNNDLMITPVTLCGNNHKDYSCSIEMPPDNYFSGQEGYIIENITIINNFHADISTTYVYETAKDIDCTAILDIVEYDSNNANTTVSLYNDTEFSLGSDNSCEMTIPIEFENDDDNVTITIYQENYIHWNMFQMEDKVTSMRNSTQDFCNNLATNYNFTYDLPINNSNYLTEVASIPDGIFCYRSMDDLYWWDYFVAGHEATEFSTIGVTEGFYSEYLYFYPFIMFNREVVARRTIEQNLVVANELINTTTQGVTFIGGTEYYEGDEGKVGVRLIKANGDSATGGTCTANILYPNMTSFVSGASMTEYADGVYYYNFTAPSTQGIYIYYTDCTVSSKDYRGMSTFHVNANLSMSIDDTNIINAISSTNSSIHIKLDLLQSDIDDIYLYLQAMNMSIYTTNQYILNNTNYLITQLSILQQNITQQNITGLYVELLYLKDLTENIDDFSQESIFLITDSVVRAEDLNTQKSTNEIKNDLYTIRNNLEILQENLIIEEPDEMSFINEKIVSNINAYIYIIGAVSLLIVFSVGKLVVNRRRVGKYEKNNSRTVDVNTFN